MPFPDTTSAGDTGSGGRNALVSRVAELAMDYLADITDRPVLASTGIAALRAVLGRPLAEQGAPAGQVVEDLAVLARTATMATTGPRYFGFVTGGSLPAAQAVEMLVAVWDQNAAMAVMSPLASVVEEVAGRWIIELLGLAPSASIGFVTGGQAANTTCLAAARHHVLAAAGWDVEQRGLNGGPAINTIVGEQGHVTIGVALRYLGLGAPTNVVAADEQGRMRPDHLAVALASQAGPAIVCLQAGNVNSGAFDDFPALIDLAHRHGAWVHVDGAFGLWAAASPAYRHLVAGLQAADSWATDGHKWLNVPYDCGYALTAHPTSHRAAHASSAGYYVLGGDEAPRDAMDWAPPKRPGALVAWPPTPRWPTWAGKVSPIWSTGAAARRGFWPTVCAKSRASRSSTTSCSTRWWSHLVTTNEPAPSWTPFSRRGRAGPAVRCGVAGP